MSRGRAACGISRGKPSLALNFLRLNAQAAACIVYSINALRFQPPPLSFHLPSGRCNGARQRSSPLSEKRGAMGARFDRWLAQPFTLHFRRRLVAAPGVEGFPASLNDRRRIEGFEPRSYSSDTSRRPNGNVVDVASRKPRRLSGARLKRENSVPFAQKETSHSLPVNMEETDSGHRQESLGEGHIRLKQTTDDFSLGAMLHKGESLSLRPYKGQSMFRRLAFQADVDGPSANEQRLVDQPEHKDDTALWVMILQFQDRIAGVRGVKRVWQGMRARNVDIPTDGYHQYVLWSTFLRAFNARNTSSVFLNPTTEQRYFEALVEYAIDLKQRTGHHYPGLYAGILGPVLRRSGNAVLWHDRLATEGMVPPNAMKLLVPYLSFSKSGRNQFRRLYQQGKERDLYDVLMPRVLQDCTSNGTRSWHDFLVKFGDRPSAKFGTEPAVQILLASEIGTDAESKRGVSTTLASDGDDHSLETLGVPFTRASMNTIVGDVHGIEKREISDTFCARLFATKVFSLDFIARSLHFFGVEVLGPLSIREMAIRSGSLSEMRDIVYRLRGLNIELGNSTYAMLAKQIVRSNSDGLFDAFLASDVHPETYNDSQTINKLLAMYLENGDWSQVHLILCALSATTSRASFKAWNALLQHYAYTRDYPSVRYTLQQMQTHGAYIKLRSLTLLHRYCLTHRSRGKRPATQVDRSRFNSLNLVTQAYIYAAKRGQYVNPLLWIESLKRYGMAGRVDELEKLIMFLASHYTSKRWSVANRIVLENTLGGGRLRRNSRTSYVFARRLPDRHISQLYLRRIFRPEMVKAIVTWAFNSAARKRKLHPVEQNRAKVSITKTPAIQPWAVGIAVVRRLRKEAGVWAPSMLVRSAVKTRLKIMFGPAYSTIKFNNMAEQHSRLSVADYVRHANEVWGSTLINIDPKLLQADYLDAETRARVLYALFGPRTRVSRRRHESADIIRWAAYLPHKPDRPRGNIREQKWRWHHSPYRIKNEQGLTSQSRSPVYYEPPAF